MKSDLNGTIGSIKPVAQNERIAFLDVLRGIAILGIFLANLQWFSFSFMGVDGQYVCAETDRKLSFFYTVFIDGKFYTIFSLLFGWGIALQLQRMVGNNITLSGFVRRRLGFMMLLGAAHLLLIWEGDIVLLYGSVGFLLWAMHQLSNRILLVWGLLLIISPILLYLLKMNIPLFNYPSVLMTKIGDYFYKLNGLTDYRSKANAYLNNKSIYRYIWINIGDAPYRYADLFFTSRIPKVLGAMLIGFVIGRSGLYHKIKQYKTKSAVFCAGLTLASFPLNYLLALTSENNQEYYNLTIEGWYHTILYAFAVFPLAMAYILAVALCFELKVMRKLLSYFAPVGKMAFTNYMLQSIIGIFTFYGIGLGLMFQMGTLAWTIFGIAVFILQIIGSTLWLKYFRFGPLEWLWRSLAYGKLQALWN